MKDFQELNEDAIQKYMITVRGFKSDSLIDSEIRQKWESKKREAINRISRDRDNRRLYQEAESNYNMFISRNNEIFTEYRRLCDYYEDTTDLLTVFTNKNKPQRFKERHKDVFNEASRLYSIMNSLERYKGKESELIKAVEQSYSVSSEQYLSFVCDEKDRYSKDCRHSLSMWRSEFKVSPQYNYLIKGLRITYGQPNVCSISCQRLDLAAGAKIFSSYNETVMNREIRIFR